MQKFRLRVRSQIVVKQIRSVDDRDVIETTLQNAVDKINASNLTREEALLKVQQLRYNKNGANLTFSDRSREGKTVCCCAAFGARLADELRDGTEETEDGRDVQGRDQFSW